MCSALSQMNSACLTSILPLVDKPAGGGHPPLRRTGIYFPAPWGEYNTAMDTPLLAAGWLISGRCMASETEVAACGRYGNRKTGDHVQQGNQCNYQKLGVAELLDHEKFTQADDKNCQR